ncbi:sensor histidine kinase [Parafilimonas terrae]|nr:ATP-binding protein [Parafilimonas terrae]
MASRKTSSEINNLFAHDTNSGFKYLPQYAKYLLENQAEAFTIAQLDVARETKLPLLNHLDINEDELTSILLKNTDELLNACIENTTSRYIELYIKKWLDQQSFSFISKQISIEDISLLSFIQRNAFRQFISGFTKDAVLTRNILTEADLFITEIETKFIKTFFELIKPSPTSPNNHTLHFQLKQANEVIKHTEWQYQFMINEIEDYAIILLDKEGFIQNWNKGAQKIKGYTAQEIIGKNFRLFYRQEDRDKNLPESLLKEATQKGKAQHEGWRLRKGGSAFWGYTVITALHDNEGNIIGFTKVTRNLTERKFTEDTLKEYAEKIEKHNEELQRINKELDSFAYMASHDLQEPLRKIRTFSNIILSREKENFSPEAANYFDRIILSVNRMQTLIDSLLNYSRAGTAQMVLEPTDLNILIQDVKKDLSEVIWEKRAVIVYNQLPTLKVHRLQFHQLFSNLIENAIKYSHSDVNPEIKIETVNFFNKDEKEFIRITVEDNGIGFEQQYAADIFKLFQRLHGKSEYSGTGIGLAICKKIVENHNGTITAVGQPGKGSTFIIEMPLDNNNTEAEV